MACLIFSSGRAKKDRRRKYPEEDLAVALTDIGLSNALDQILNDDHWVDDATGLIPHCLSILRNCHTLTERLANLAMRPMDMKGSTNRLIEAAKRIPSRVDDVGKCKNQPHKQIGKPKNVVYIIYNKQFALCIHHWMLVY